MSRFRLRPKFSHDIKLDIESIQKKIRDYFEKEALAFEFKEFPGFICLRIPESDRHFWSPRLNLSFEKKQAAHTLVHGVYGPNANVWSLFLFSYLMVGFLALIGGVVGISQMSIGSSPWGFWGLGIGVAMIIGIYFVAQTGRKLGASQTLRLHRVFEKAIGERISIR